MSVDNARFFILGVLLVHGLGHGGAVGALMWVARGNPGNGWQPARSWVLPALAETTATSIATGFWIAAMLGFVGAAAAFLFVPGESWRVLAIVSSLVSLAGMALFAGTWPAFNTVAALAVNLLTLGLLLFAHWPPVTMFGK